MRKFQDTPTFWRYFGARLKPFTRPLFLGSVGFLTLSGVAFYQYWHHPDWLQNKIEQPLEAVFGSRESQEIPQIPEEDLAVVADVDNIDLLLQEMEQNQATNPFNVAPDQKKKSSKKDSPSTAFSSFQEKQKNKLKNASASNPSYLRTDNSALDELLKPPSFTNYRSPISTQIKKNQIANGSASKIIPNPVGRLYLSNKNSSLKNTPTSPYSDPYINTNPLSRLGSVTPREVLGDRSRELNLRQPKINITETRNTTNNPGTFPNEAGVATSNEALNQPTSINTTSINNRGGLSPTSVPNQFPSYPPAINNFYPSSPLNTSGNTNRANLETNQNSLQPINPNIYPTPTPNYNQSVPSSYQLQPQSFLQPSPRSFNQLNSVNSNPLGNSLGTNNQFNRNNSLSNSVQNQQFNNTYVPNSIQTGQLNNQPIINRTPNRILQLESPLYNTRVLR
ncbi:MAG: hypothetical protein QNJ65_01040 [Xenococcaceae cyanobacterium MO_234.B1]|nr:hypothetical protein [Xenococcaceae cyanobacterium MO_234.B1]